jgi:hypothetical protein
VFSNGNSFTIGDGFASGDEMTGPAVFNGEVIIFEDWHSRLQAAIQPGAVS